MPEPIYFPALDQTLHVATEGELLDFANAVREAGGGDPIPALMPSYPQNPHSCLIANALNFGCRVLPIGYIEVLDAETEQPIRISEWFMYVDDPEVAAKIAESVDGAEFMGYEFEGENAIRLPVHIGNAAEAFDMEVAFTDFDARHND